MIVDDDPQVCVYVALVLKRLGFQSSVNTNPLEELLENPTEYRILLTDQKIPELSGLELINRLWASIRTFRWC